MLQMVAMPVHDSDSTPSPKYSMMAPVPPLTVRMPATLRMTSAAQHRATTRRQRPALAQGQREEGARTLGGGPARDLASELDTDPLRALELPGKVGDNVDGVSSTDTDGDHAKTTSVGRVRVGTDHETSGERVVLEDDLRAREEAGPGQSSGSRGGHDGDGLGKAKRTWWMIPEPGFQKPMPYLAVQVARKS